MKNTLEYILNKLSDWFCFAIGGIIALGLFGLAMILAEWLETL